MFPNIAQSHHPVCIISSCSCAPGVCKEGMISSGWGHIAGLSWVAGFYVSNFTEFLLVATKEFSDRARNNKKLKSAPHVWDECTCPVSCVSLCCLIPHGVLTWPATQILLIQKYQAHTELLFVSINTTETSTSLLKFSPLNQNHFHLQWNQKSTKSVCGFYRWWSSNGPIR